jgi:putative endonuclease
MNSNKKWVAYLVRCSDNSLYCGISKDLKSRILDHNSGKGAKYTRSRRPVKLVGVSSKLTKSDALRLGYKIKQLPAHRKIAELARKKAERAFEQDQKVLEKEVKSLDFATNQ